MKIEINPSPSGVQQAIDQLKQVKENLKNVEGSHAYTFREIFNDDFMSAHTKFSNISDFLKASGMNFDSGLHGVDINELDSFISGNSDFANWEEMKSAAGKSLIESKIIG